MAATRHGGKGDSPHLCEAPFGPFRQMGTVPFFPSWQLASETTSKILVTRLKIADGFWSRLVGLQFRRKLPSGAGLLLVPCNSVHTCFVRFPVDVVFLDRRGRVLAIHQNLRPWRLTFGPRGSHAALEVGVGSADFHVGELLRLTSTEEPQAVPPTSVAFLRK